MAAGHRPGRQNQIQQAVAFLPDLVFASFHVGVFALRLFHFVAARVSDGSRDGAKMLLEMGQKTMSFQNDFWMERIRP